MMMLTNELHG